MEILPNHRSGFERAGFAGDRFSLEVDLFPSIQVQPCTRRNEAMDISEVEVDVPFLGADDSEPTEGVPEFDGSVGVRWFNVLA